MSDKLTSALDDARDAVDAAANFCLTFLAAAVIGAVAFRDERLLLAVPLTALLFAMLAYVGAIAAATEYGLLVSAAFDLHRFDMIKALHYKLPVDEIEDRMLGSELRIFFSRREPGRLVAWAYRHD